MLFCQIQPSVFEYAEFCCKIINFLKKECHKLLPIQKMFCKKEWTRNILNQMLYLISNF